MAGFVGATLAQGKTFTEQLIMIGMLVVCIGVILLIGKLTGGK